MSIINGLLLWSARRNTILTGMKRVLFFSNSPALSVSLPFFLNVPLFLLLAAVLLWWAGPQAMMSRWNEATLALTHLLTLGVLASAMLGALMQVLPVATAVRVVASPVFALGIYSALTSGTLLLAAGFLSARADIARIAFVLLALAFGAFFLAVVVAMLRHRHTRVPASEPLFRSAQLALLALMLTVGLGLALLATRAWGVRLSIPGITDVHGAWGLLGWTGLLMAGVSFKVIPVFQATELYPRHLMRGLAPAVFIALTAWSALTIWLPYPVQWPAGLMALLLGVLYLVYALVSLRLLHRRKRPQPDTNTRFWRLAMVSFAACLPCWVLLQLWPTPHIAMALGVLMVVGVAVSAINGMLYKIIPVLLCNHAQMPLKEASPLVPKVKQILPDHMGIWQFRLQCAALLLLLLACIWPVVFTGLAALASFLSAAWLLRNILSALQLYWRARQQIRASLR